jgi:fatty acid desaturase
MTTMAAGPTHDELIERMTGGLAPTGLMPFTGSERLRPDGRPRPAFRARLRRIADVRNAITTVASLALPVAVVAAVIAIDHWLAVVAAIPVMGVLQNRLFILHHEAAHRLLFSNRRWNDLIGVVLVGWIAFGTGSHSYRRGHANHHRDEFGPKEPDLVLYSFYPITTESMRRKLMRDMTGVSAYRILRPRITGLFQRKYLKNSLRFFAGQAVIFALFSAVGHPWLYLLLWVLPYASVYQVLNRLRAIAEHGGLTRSPDRRVTSHHVRQSWLSSILMVPYGIGWHLAHHVDSGIPFRNLPVFTRALEEDGYITPEHTWPSYRALWRALASG